MRKFIIKASKQITLPVTPESFEVSYGRRTETVNIHEVGDVNLPGGLALGTIKISCMFPEQDYPFALDAGDPYSYVDSIKKLIKKKKPVRFIVSGTGVNERVLVEDIAYGERDGTGDVYATITMRGYREVSATQTVAVLGVVTTSQPTVPKAGANRPRDQEKNDSEERIYHAKKGQTFYEICRVVYGSGSASGANAIRLANYNGYGSLRMTLEKDMAIKYPPISSLMKNAYRDLTGVVE